MMRERVMRSFLLVVIGLWLGQSAEAAGDLAIKAEKLTLKLGSEKSDYALEPKRFHLTTGKAYRLRIVSKGFKEYEMEAEEFFRNVWLRKIEVDNVTLDVPMLSAIEFEANYEESEAEITFVPIRSGEFEFSIEGLEEKGMVGEFVVK